MAPAVRTRSKHCRTWLDTFRYHEWLCEWSCRWKRTDRTRGRANWSRWRLPS